MSKGADPKMPHRMATISCHWYPYQNRTLSQVEAAVNCGYEVDVICLAQPGEKRFEASNGVRVYRMPINRSPSAALHATLVQWYIFMVLAAITITWLHLRRRYTIIHVHNMPDVLVFSAAIPRLLGARIILDVQDVSPELMAAKIERKGLLRYIVVRLAQWQERISIAFAHHVVTTGSVFEGILLKRGVPREKITQFLNSANPSLFPPERRCAIQHSSSDQDRPFIFMYHGTLSKRNGLDVAIRALAIARGIEKNLRLDIQGGGDHLTYLKELAEDLGVGDAVQFTGFSPPERLADFIAHRDVGIIPYRHVGFSEFVLPSKAYEYAWMQRPIIASNTIAIRSMFRRESIVLCDPNRPECFAQAMIDLYRHPEKRARMVANAAEDYAPYRWELMAERYQRLLTSLSRKQRRGRVTQRS